MKRIRYDWPPSALPLGLHLTVYHSVLEAEPAWRALTDESQCYVFQTFEWASLWYQTIGKVEQVKPFIVCVTDSDGHPVIMFPLGVRRRYRCRILLFLGGDVTDYNAPLFGARFPQLYADGRIDRLWEQIVQISAADVVWLKRMPETLPNRTNPLIAEAHARHKDNAYVVMPLPATFTAFVASRSRAYFADTRRKRRKLERIGPLTLDLPQSSQDIADIVEAALRQKRRRIAERGGKRMPRQHENFYRALAMSSIPHGGPHVASLRVNGELVSTHVGVVHEQRFYWLIPGYEGGDWARLSVGRALLQSLVEWCIASHMDAFDLTVGDEEYKRFWANARLKLYESRYAPTLRGACFLACSRLKALAVRSMTGFDKALRLRRAYRANHPTEGPGAGRPSRRNR